MSLLPHKASKDYYGGETMPEGVEDCNCCGWTSKEENFRYGLCSFCGEPEWWEEDEDSEE